MVEAHGTVGRGAIKVGGGGVAAFIEQVFIVSEGADPLAGWSLTGFLGNEANQLWNRWSVVRAAVELMEPGGEGEKVAVGVVEARDQAHPVAVASECPGVCQGVEVLFGADGDDAIVLYGDGGCQRLGGFQGQNPGIEQQQVCFFEA